MLRISILCKFLFPGNTPNPNTFSTVQELFFTCKNFVIFPVFHANCCLNSLRIFFRALRLTFFYFFSHNWFWKPKSSKLLASCLCFAFVFFFLVLSSNPLFSIPVRYFVSLRFRDFPACWICACMFTMIRQHKLLWNWVSNSLPAPFSSLVSLFWEEGNRTWDPPKNDLRASFAFL